jgi:rod shape-determining protein MreC
MRDNQLIVLAVLGVLFLVLLNLPVAVVDGLKHGVREGIAPLQAALSRVSRGMGAAAGALRGAGRLRGENEKLSQEVARLGGEVRHLTSLERENAELRRQLSLAAKVPRRLVAGEVLSRDADGWWQIVRLNKGSDEGVGADMAVISVDGLLGKIVDVTRGTADVLLISDPACRVSAQIARTGSFGIVAGRGPTWKGQVICRMDFINRDKPVMAGDEVITSGLGGVFPKGLLIGYVESVHTDRSGLYQFADVVSAADLGMVEYAFVVVPETAPIRETAGARAEGGP